MSTNKRALVTGASEGIGRTFALKLAQKGFAVTAVARNEQRLVELVKEMGGAPHNYLAADLTDSADLLKVQNDLTKNGYDLLVNNAGLAHFGPFTHLTEKSLMSMLRLNMEALTLLAYRFLKTAKPGQVLINTSSVLSFEPSPLNAVYAASKAYVTSFTESLWYEYKKTGIYILNLCPGATESQFNQRAGGLDGRIPKWIIQTSSAVVDEALENALHQKSQPTVVTGYKNKFMVFILSRLPRKTLVSLLGRVNKKQMQMDSITHN